ncbi:hypothetical protein FJQ98_21800 [Lysinibacillus agricola]|uniref:HTH cro/C1-type domain-containing protein n=1 Tax=Lysinibacillus agricola TaxID=2590012 RepID=A0ABX7APA7_9BACI|nr:MULTISPECIES: hypothetical protein [Lysinibacillus]KOS64742.1 hypothetical protein AN161_00185 [Lysinibacillus sp. FJAT-14222]QQP11787.1 hypothetical protein FJQ98_21800 [Lysinibacillus agricola]
MKVTAKEWRVMSDRNKQQKKIGTSQPNLSKKLQNNSLSVADLEKIAIALDVKFDLYFTLENGDQI